MKPFNNYKSLKKVYAIFIVVLLLNYISLIYFGVYNNNIEHFDTDLNKIYSANDSDGDGMPDDWEDTYGLNKFDSSDKFEDLDDDTVLNYYEYLNGTKPNDRDSDKDGMWDGWEIYYGLNPINKSDNMNDNDDDGLKNFEEFFYETNPNNNDTDSDGLLDFDEIKIYGTLPNSADSDGDGMEDGWEINYKLDPLNNTDATLDMDNDGIGDTPFIMGGVIDNYPLMEPIENYEIIGIHEPEQAPFKIPGYNLFFLLSILSVVAILLGKKLKKS